MVYITITDLAIEVIIRAFFTIAFVIVSLITGIKLMSKYKKNKNIVYLTVGLTWIFIGSSYWGFTFGFLSILILSYQFEHSLFLILNFGFIPFAVIFWFYSFAKLYNQEKFKLLFYPIFTLYFALFIIQIVLFLVNYELAVLYIGSPSDPFQYSRKIVIYFVSILALFLVIISATLIGLKSIKAKDPLIVWRGRFILLGLYFFIFGTLIDIFASGNLLLQILARMILIICSIFYYLGLHLPPKIMQILLKNR